MSREPPEQPSSQPSHSFRESELSLLTESSDSSDVKVNTPNVAPEVAHRYPKLAGADWTCYITTDRIVLGRSPGPEAPKTRQKKAAHVDIDFGHNKRDVSRFHAEVRYSTKRMRWELRVYGKNGVKVNHNWKTPKESPVPLSTGSLIEILGVRCVFILPANGGAPVGTSAATPELSTPEPTSNQPSDTPETDIPSSQDNILREIDADGRLEAMIVDAFQERSHLTTDHIMEYIAQRQAKEGSQRAYDKSSVLHALILNPKFQLLESFADNDTDQQVADPIQWTLRITTPVVQDNVDDLDYNFDIFPEPQLKPQVPNNINKTTSAESALVIRGISIEDVYSTWTAAQQLKKQASFMSLDEPVNSPNMSSAIAPSVASKRPMDDPLQDSLKRQRSGLSARKLGLRGTGKPWKDMRTTNLTFFTKR